MFALVVGGGEKERRRLHVQNVSSVRELGKAPEISIQSALSEPPSCNKHKEKLGILLRAIGISIPYVTVSLPP